MAINPADVPPALRELIPLAERWGIGDDVDRSMAVEEAALGDLHELISRVRDTPDEVWNDWLAGSEAEGPPWPEAYHVFTCLVMAYEEARVVVTKRGA